jgi:diguanylate cyclase (GGDEF)-like protein
VLFENNIYLDRLTGMPNFFKFVESDVSSMFSDSGAVIVFDLAKFQETNNNYGRETGDLFLKNFADTLRYTFRNSVNTEVFRTHGDEFTVILRNVSYNDAKELAYSIRMEYKNIMEGHNFLDADVHVLILEYSEKITSINQYYKAMFKKSLEELKQGDKRYREERMLDSIIGNFTNRIQETLSLLNSAYSLAFTDDISCLPNQRAAKIYLEKLLNENGENLKEFSILFIDGDNLKRYNTISYAKGNEMIKELSSVIASSLRKNDRIFRWLTGDEFLVILDNVTDEDAMKLAERIRVSVEEQTRFWTYSITVSIGIACYPKDGKCIEEVLNKAEKANVIAKSRGKNKVIKWEEKLTINKV